MFAMMVFHVSPTIVPLDSYSLLIVAEDRNKARALAVGYYESDSTYTDMNAWRVKYLDIHYKGRKEPLVIESNKQLPEGVIFYQGLTYGEREL